jgi:hypothetical protein
LQEEPSMRRRSRPACSGAVADDHAHEAIHASEPTTAIVSESLPSNTGTLSRTQLAEATRFRRRAMDSQPIHTCAAPSDTGRGGHSTGLLAVESLRRIWKT